MARQILLPLIVTLVVAAILLILERSLRIFDFVINEGGPFYVVWKMLAALIPYHVSTALPYGLFLGVVLAFRKLSLNNEIDAMQTMGLGLPRLIRPAIVVAVLLVGMDFLLINYIQPYGRYTYQSLEFELRSGAFGASVKVGEFNRIGDDLTIRVDASYEGGRRLSGIFVQKEYEDSMRVTAITAREGTVLNTGDGKTLLLRLSDGVALDIDPIRPTPTVLRFALQDVPVTLPEVAPLPARGSIQREMTFDELWRATMTGRGSPDWTANRAALHNRVIRPLSLLIIPFLATPFGFLAKRTGRAFGLAVGFGILLLYYKVLEFGQAFAALGDASPWVSLWGPVVLFAAAFGFLYWRSAFKIGANPLAWLDALWDALQRILARFLPGAEGSA